MQLPKLKKVSEVKKKKILLLSDDLRMSSGVGTMSREIVMGTIKEYDWVQVAGAIKHPDAGKAVDMCDSVRKDSGVEDAYLKLYPVDGYGSQDLLRNLIEVEKPDAILHYTDPRFWKWLYDMEHEVRQHIPIYYYNIWDDLPYPMWNEPFYESCDLIMNISKQTHNIVQNVCFCLFYNNRNIKRKMTSDAIMAFKTFADKLPKAKRDRVAFVLHTQPTDQHGTDLPAVVEAMCPDLNIIFSTEKLSPQHLNYLYNIADVTINIASNEGFGLGTCESLMAGTPIIVNVTGGLQDQCGFKFRDHFLTYKDYGKIETLHDWRKWQDNKDLTWGEWVKPVWPKSRSLQGSIPTPYIFDDRIDYVDVSEKINEWYEVSSEEREEAGFKGHEFVCGEESMMSAKAMCGLFIDHMNTAFEKWTPRERYEVYKV